MSSLSDSDSSIRSIDILIADYMASMDAGKQEPLESFIAKHPQHADALRTFFQQDQAIHHAYSGTARSDGTPLARTWPLKSFTSKEPQNEIAWIGDYEILEEIARGGMGVVYRARHRHLGRTVALKVILQGDLATQAELQRSRSEAEAAAHLDHPGIVPIYEIGEYHGLPYYTMAFVPGISLAQALQHGPLPVDTSVRLLIALCDALQHAHDRGVIHRDLKPANILLQADEPSNPKEVDALQRESETNQHQWKPRITDFGLAKRLCGQEDFTRTGQIVGTPNYMSPEQASGHSSQVGPSSDLYSLGAVFYQMLVGHPPFLADNPIQTLKQVLESDPVPLRLYNRTIPKDVEAICLKCLQKTTEQRYASAHDLQSDLERFARGEEVLARSIPLLDRLANLLKQDRNEAHFQGWGSTLIAFAIVILISHAVIYGLDRYQAASWWAYLPPRIAMFGSLFFVLHRARTYSILPTNSVERLVWAIWMGYLMAIGTINAILSTMGRSHTETYPFFAVLAGFGFFVMGTPVWRGGYILGVLWMIMAPLLVLAPQTAPLWIGSLWFVSLVAFGLYYRHSPKKPTS
ncbi:MAG: serine/threonine-protein kinase [Pirellulales bacterium]